MKRSASMTGNDNKKQKPAEPIELESMDTSQTMDTAESAHDTSLGSRTPLGPLSSLRLHWPIRPACGQARHLRLPDSDDARAHAQILRRLRVVRLALRGATAVGARQPKHGTSCA